MFMLEMLMFCLGNHCRRRTQYYFLLTLLLLTCVPYMKPVHSQIAGPLLLYSTKTDIRLSNFAKHKNTTLVKDIRDGSAFDYHYRQSKLCWVDRTVESIQCASFNATGITSKVDVVAHLEVSLDGLACDWLTNKLYWTDLELDRIEVVSMTDYHRKVLYWKEVDQPRAIALDPLRGLLFWTDWGDMAKIERAGMNGDPSTRKVIVNSDIFWPNGLTIDYDNQHIFWIDGKLLFLKRVDYNGNKEEIIVESTSHYPYALTFFNGRLYWTDWRVWQIWVYDLRNNTRSSKPPTQKVLYTTDVVPMDLNILDASRQPFKSTPCDKSNGGCSHLCLLAPTAPFYNCACPSGIKLINSTTCADRPQELLIFARRTEIGIVYLDSPDYKHKFLNYTNMKHSVAVDYDPVEGYVYWTDTNISKIQRAKLDGSEQSDVLAYEVESSDGIAIDWLSRNIYWTDSALDRIEVATLNGKFRKVLVYEGLVNPRAIAVAPYEEHLFWSDWNDKNPKIERARLDGSGRTVIVAEGLGWANGLALDFDKQRIYWCDAKLDKIEHANFDGSDRVKLIDNIPHAFGLSILGRFLYWTDWQKRTISRVSMATGGDVELILEQISNIMGLKAIQGTPFVADSRAHPCQASNCDQICLLVNQSRTCKCHFGFELAADERSCRVPDAYLLYARRDGLSRASIEQLNRTASDDFLPIGGVKNATSMDLDVNDMRVYWSDAKQRTIMRAYLNGSDPHKVVELGLQSPQGLAVDWVALNVYWADPAQHRIEVSRLDGSSRRVLLWQKSSVEPHFIALDPQEGCMYWTEFSSSELPNNSIRKAGMDGSHAISLVVLTGVPSGLILDHDARRLYWLISRPTAAIGLYSSDLNGLNKQVLVNEHLFRPVGLVVYHDHVYWTDALSESKQGSSHVAQIARADKVTGGNRMIVQLLADTPTDLLVVSNSKRRPVSNACALNNGDCSHLCLALPRSNPSFTCACPTHYKLQSNACVPPKKFMVYSYRNLAVRLLPDTSECLEAVLPIQGMRIVRAIDFDPNLQFLYWIEGKNRSIKKAKAIGMHVSGVLMNLPHIDPTDIALDALGRLLFWSCSNQNVINVTRVDNSSAVGVIVQDADERPRLLAIHPLKRLLFYTDVSDPPKVVRRLMDGTRRKVIVARATSLNALAVDVDNDLVVWSQGSSIFKCNLDGTSPTLMVNESTSQVLQLTVLNGWLYWVDNDSMRRMQTTGSDNASALVLDLDAGISDLISVSEPDKSHPCARMLCSHICVLGESNEALCSCPRNMTLFDNTTCMLAPNCGPEFFTCNVQTPGMKDCIPLSWICDGQKDCTDGSDEDGCATCQLHEFKCQSGECIDWKYYCDLEPHCKDKSDEAHCCKSTHEFQCRGTQVCIASMFLCDGIENCANGEDENRSVCNAVINQPAPEMSVSSILLWSFLSLLFLVAALAAYYYIKRAIYLNNAAISVLDDAQDPLNPEQAQGQIKMQKARNKTLGIPDVVHMSMLSASQSCSYDRGHITGASSSTNDSTMACYPRETLNPPPSPATTAASTRANSPTSRYRPYKHYRSCNQPPPPTPCSTDVNDESDYNYSSRSRYDDRRYDLGPFPPPPTPRSHCNSESCPPSPSSRSSTYFSPLPPPPSPVASPGRSYDS